MPHLLTVEDVKDWCRIDDVEDEAEQARIDAQIRMLIGAAREFLLEATGRAWTSKTERARLCALAFIADNWDNRTMSAKEEHKVSPIVQSLLAQLTYGSEEVVDDD